MIFIIQIILLLCTLFILIFAKRTIKNHLIAFTFLLTISTINIIGRYNSNLNLFLFLYCIIFIMIFTIELIANDKKEIIK